MSVNSTPGHTHGLHVVIPPSSASTATRAAPSARANDDSPAPLTPAHAILPTALDTPTHLHGLGVPDVRPRLRATNSTPGHTHGLFTVNSTPGHTHGLFVAPGSHQGHSHGPFTGSAGFAEEEDEARGTPGHTHGLFGPFVQGLEHLFGHGRAAPRPNARVARRSSLFTADEDRFGTAEDANADAAQELPLPATSETDELHTGELDGSFEAAQAAGEAGAHAHAKA